MATYSDLAKYVDADLTDTSVQAFVTDCFNVADALVTEFIGTNTVPTVIKDRCVLMVGKNLYRDKNTIGGYQQFTSADQVAVRTPRDPMTSVYPILGRYMVIGL